MPPRIEIAPEVAAAARELYERTLTPIDLICAHMGVSRSVLYARAKEWKWQGRRYSGAEEELQALSAAGAEAPPVETAPAADIPPPVGGASIRGRRKALHLRVLAAAELEMTAIEHSLRLLNPKTEAQSERTARTAAALNRSLRELFAIITTDPVATDEPEHDAIPRDLDALRNELARRINAFVDGRRRDHSERDRREHDRLDGGGD